MEVTASIRKPATPRPIHQRIIIGQGAILQRGPLDWYPELKDADDQSRQHWQFLCRGTGIEWPELDYHLSIESMLLGVPAKGRQAVAS